MRRTAATAPHDFAAQKKTNGHGRDGQTEKNGRNDNSCEDGRHGRCTLR